MALFSISAFLVVFRESIEAALIVGILFAYLTKTNKVEHRKDIWIGTIVAIILSLIGAVIFLNIVGGFEGKAEYLFEGIVMILAALVLSWMIIWMRKNAKYLKYELQEKMDTAIEGNRRYALIGLAFIAVFREGIETVLIVGAIASSETVGSVILGSLSGFSLAILAAIALFGYGIRLNIQKFFNITSFLLIIFAAGLWTYGIHELQEFGLFGVESASWNTPFLNFSEVLNDKLPSNDNPNGSVLGAMLRALIGYQDKPTLVEAVAYVLYWIGILALSGKINKSVKVEANKNSISG